MTGTKSVILLVSAFLALSSTTDVVHRDGRFFLDLFNIVRLNPISRVVVGIALNIPLSVFMPDLGVFGRQSRSRGHSTLKWPFQQEEAFPTCSSQGMSTKDYLHLLQIDLEPCQELFICEIASDPNKFMPLSEILLKKLSVNKWMKNPRFSHMVNSTEYDLFMAAQTGSDPNQECHVKYWDCPVDATSMVNMNILTGLQFLSNSFDIRFIGETEAHLLKY